MKFHICYGFAFSFSRNLIANSTIQHLLQCFRIFCARLPVSARIKHEHFDFIGWRGRAFRSLAPHTLRVRSGERRSGKETTSIGCISTISTDISYFSAGSRFYFHFPPSSRLLHRTCSTSVSILVPSPPRPSPRQRLPFHSLRHC